MLGLEMARGGGLIIETCMSTNGLSIVHKTDKICSSGGRVALAIHRCQKPTIAAMQGSAVGVGMTMTLPAAIRYLALERKVSCYHNILTETQHLSSKK